MVNEYGVPLHACWGYRADAHYWAWIGQRLQRGEFGEALRLQYERTTLAFNA